MNRRAIWVAAVIGLLVQTARAADLPRYNLPVGMQLVYSNHMENAVGERAYAYDGRWEFTIIKDNPDGSKHLMALKALSVTYTANGQSRSGSENITRGYFDMKPDGQMKMNPTLLPAFNPQIIFPRLPANEQDLENGWKGSFERSNVTTVFTPEPADSGELVFTGNETGPYHTINQRTDKWTYHFDPSKGLVTKIDAENGQTYGAEQKGSAQIVLERAEQLADADLKSMADEHDSFVKAYEKSDELMRKALAGASNADEITGQAQQTLNEAAANANTDAVKADFADAIARAQNTARLATFYQQRQQPLKGQPAMDFALTDLAGQTHKLADEQGKLVVLDFFKRQENQAAYTIPQIVKLSEKYKNKGVVFFGMTTDSDDADSKLVVNALSIPYPVLKLEGPTTDFGVQNLPATVIIDQKGNIQSILQGYSKSRGQDVDEKLQELLKNPAQ